jgi:hypothetical protein
MTPDPGHSFLRENCDALAVRDPEMAMLILESTPDPSFSFASSRSGALVPGVRGPGGVIYLHSRYDPAQEARRQSAAWADAGCVVVFGLGAGFHVSAMLESSRVASVLVVEKDAAVLRALFERVPFSGIIGDGRAAFLAGPRELRLKLPRLWQPALMGGLRSFPLRAWCDLQRDFCSQAATELEYAVQSARADLSVQAHFGRRWFLNMLGNFPAAENSAQPGPLERARVAAAGPSLDAQAARLAGASREGPLLSVDTSLPALLRRGIVPDGVVSIDCQIYCYHHFFQGLPAATTLFLDLASPPLAARGRERVRFVAGNHPFAAYVSRYWRRFTIIETSGGNVTHAAVSLALALGAGTVTLYGADFSYPSGKAYARGTYLYDFFGAASDRTRPIDARFWTLVNRTGDARAERSSSGARLRTPLLDSYHERMQELIKRSGGRIVAVPGAGLPFEQWQGDAADAALAGGAGRPGATPASTRSGGMADFEPSCHWRDFLDHYALELARLPGVADPPWKSFGGLSAGQVETWATVLPIAAQMTRAAEGGRAPRAHLGEAATLEAARSWAVAMVRRQVNSQE